MGCLSWDRLRTMYWPKPKPKGAIMNWDRLRTMHCTKCVKPLFFFFFLHSMSWVERTSLHLPCNLRCHINYELNFVMYFLRLMGLFYYGSLSYADTRFCLVSFRGGLLHHTYKVWFPPITEGKKWVYTRYGAFHRFNVVSLVTCIVL